MSTATKKGNQKAIALSPGMKKAVRRAVNGLAVVLVAGVALLVAVAILPGLVGLNPIVVLSGSMEPALRVGDIAVTRAVDPATLKVGDVVTYRSGSGLVTHRIISMQETPDGRLFQVKGDNNLAADDKPVAEDQVIAKVVYGVPKVGFIVAFANSQLGQTLMIAAPAVILFLMWIREQEKKKARSRQQAGHGAGDHGPSCDCLACWSAARGIPYESEPKNDRVGH